MARPKSGDFNAEPVSPKGRKATKARRYTKDNPMPAELRIEPKRVQCDRCGTSQWANSEGNPRPHLRDAVPGDAEYRTDLPTKAECHE